MSAIDPLLRFPSRARGDEFQADCDYFFGELNRIFDQVNAVAASFISVALSGTSTSSVAVSTTGTKTFATQSGKSWLPGQFLVASSVLSPGVFMVGQVASYSSASGTLVLSVQRAVGVGTFTAWNITLAAPANALNAADLLTGIVPEDRLAGGNYRAINLLRANQVSASQAVINSAAPELVFSETGLSSPAGLWRILLEADALRVNKATSAGDFQTFQEWLRIDSNGRINGDGSGLTGVSAARLQGASGLAPSIAARAACLYSPAAGSIVAGVNISSIVEEAPGQHIINLIQPVFQPGTGAGIPSIQVTDPTFPFDGSNVWQISASQYRVRTFANNATSTFRNVDFAFVLF